VAWTAPRTWSVSEVVTAANMNTHVRDNLDYLKGNAGTVAIADSVTLPTVTGTTGDGLRFTSGGTDYANFQGMDLSSNTYIFFSSNRYYTGAAWAQLNARAGAVLQLTQDDLSFSTFPAASSTPTERWRITDAGDMSIGAGVAPGGRLHVVGGEISGGGFCINSLAAVTSIETMFIAGTVPRAISLYIFDRNNTGGATVASQNLMVALSGSTSYVNSDTITVAVTAGGAVTCQRTSGTNGTHDIVIMGILL
jgi:hypothetical protein